MKNELNVELTSLGAQFLIANKEMPEAYQVPEQYFEVLSDELNFIPNKDESVYVVPENYFSDFENKILDQVQKQENFSSQTKNKRATWLRPLISIAASLFFVFGAMYVTQKVQSQQTNSWSDEQLEMIYSELDQDEIDWLISPATYVFDGLENELFVQPIEDLELLNPIFEPIDDAQDRFDSIFLSI